MGCRKKSIATSGRDHQRRLFLGKAACAPAATHTPKEISRLVMATGSRGWKITDTTHSGSVTST